MIPKRVEIIILLILCLLPLYSAGAQTSNAGFIPENIWYSIDNFQEGDKVKIYTVVFNPDSRELSGTVVFFDNNVFFIKKDFVVMANSVKDVSVDWIATSGNHSVFAKIENAKFLISPGKYEEVYLAENETSKNSRFISKKPIIPTPTVTNADNTSNPNLNINSIVDTAGTIGQDSVKSIGKIIEDNTPDFISTPVTLTTNAVETFRQDTATTLKNQKTIVQKDIDKLNVDDKANLKKTGSTLTTDDFTKPLKFTELFALALFSNIFDNKFIFYTLLILFVFLVLYYIFRRIKSKK